MSPLVCIFKALYISKDQKEFKRETGKTMGRWRGERKEGRESGQEAGRREKEKRMLKVSTEPDDSKIIPQP